MAATHIGTPLYISPEMYQGNPYSYKVSSPTLSFIEIQFHCTPYSYKESGGGGGGVSIYNNLLLNHLWSCVLKLVSELHDFI